MNLCCELTSDLIFFEIVFINYDPGDKYWESIVSESLKLPLNLDLF